MEGKNDLLNQNDNSIKIIDIKSNFKKARKVSPSNFAEHGKKKKSVVFLEPPKELKSPNIKKTQIIKNTNKIFTPDFQTEIGHSKRRKSKNNVKPSKVKSARNHTIKKLPTQKTKVVNINKHYFIPIITQFDTSTVISTKNENQSKKKKENNNSKINTSERNIRKIDFNGKIKKIEIKSGNKNLKEKKVINEDNDKNDKNYINDDEDNSLNQKKFIDDNCRNILKKSFTMAKDKKDSIKSNKSQESGTKKLTDKNNVSELKKIKIENNDEEDNNIENIEKLEHNSNHNNNSNNKDESINNKENNKPEEKQSNDDNLTNKINIHTKNNSVDKTKKKGNKKYNDNIIKKLLCCLYG